MPAIADSTAFRDDNRSLPQHQAFITLLQNHIADPDATVNWLDLACGRGQILAGLREQIDDKARARISYHGFDIRPEFTRQTFDTASSLGMRSSDVTVGEVATFTTKLDPKLSFDFLTLTNAIHEISPKELPAILLDSIGRLTAAGTMYLYDMESLSPCELGAVTWSRDEFRTISATLCGELGVQGYQIPVSLWPHRTCNGWSTQIQRQHLGLSEGEFDAKKDAAKLAITSMIFKLLESKLGRCKKALEALTVHKPATTEEEREKESLLYDFWAIQRAME